ncbi:MAG: hypothetical protein BGO85_23480 [Enterobacter sp. 56-7]|nr:MAG: hypothetical protein BGO85_23480 [Enterobacter sp. 56-7]
MVNMHRPKLDVRLPVAPEFKTMEQNGGIQATAKPHQQLAVR